MRGEPRSWPAVSNEYANRCPMVAFYTRGLADFIGREEGVLFGINIGRSS